MTSLKILICGGGCAGPALAFWLARSGHRVTVVEKFPALRATGAQIDLRAQGIEVVKRTGILETIRSRRVDEAGVSWVDSQGNVQATIMANTSGRGAQSLTSEYEIMRGGLVRILYDATSDKVQYVFGKTVERFEQDEKEVVAYFSDGCSDNYDLLVGADGQGSRIRKAILSPDAQDPYRRTGMHVAYWFVPREEGDNNIRRTYLSPGGRGIMRRTHNLIESQVYFILKDDRPEASSVSRAPLEKQKQFWEHRFRGAGWQTERFLDGLKTTQNFHYHEVVQVHIDKWSKGRVVLLGDAAHCPSLMTGMGTSGSFVGAYVLAGEINRYSDDLETAFVKYEETLQPFVNEIQTLRVSLIKLIFPETQWGVSIIHFIAWLACLIRIPDLISRLSSENKGGWALPDYPELRT